MVFGRELALVAPVAAAESTQSPGLDETPAGKKSLGMWSYQPTELHVRNGLLHEGQ